MSLDQLEQTATLMSFDEIIDDLMKTMNDSDRLTWLSVAATDLIMGHHTTGRAIRNYYRLWEEGNPTVGTKHPDDVSMEIMHAVWARAQKENAVRIEAQKLPENETLLSSLKV